MIACLSPNGQNTTRGGAPPTRLLVATVEGVSVLDRGNAGAPWQNRGHKLEGKHCSSLMIEPRRGGIFAGFHENGGLYYSADNGETWERRMNGITIDHVFSIAYAHDGDNIVLYAGTEPASIFRSDDYGLTWAEQPGIKEAPGREKWMFPGKPHIPHVKSISVSLTDPNMVWALVEQGALLRTTDGGKTWIEQDHYSKPEDHNYRDVHQLTMHPVNTSELWLTTGMGTYHSLDTGDTWEQITDNSFRVGYPDHTFVSPLDPETMFVSGAEMYPGHWKKVNRADPTVMKSRDRGRTWADSSTGLSEDRRANFEAMSMAIYPGGFSLFVGTTDGEVFESDDAAERWTQIANGLGPVSKIYHYKNLIRPAIPA
jgi:photosystem II stability/assembly factor-like uncharacterized protein